MNFAWALLALPLAAQAADPAPVRIAPFSAQPAGAVQKPWGLFGLPGKPETPQTDIHVEPIDGKQVLAVRTDSSYGNAIFPWPAGAPAPHKLQWSWRLDEALKRSDLKTKSGDDVALKLCVLFDMPLEALPWAERTYIRMARSSLRQPIPSASICYIWDTQLPVGTTLPNAFTQRLRYVVVDTGPATKRWTPHTVDVKADFLRLFGGETHTLPPIIGIGIGGDADNTQGRSLGFVGDVQALP